MAESETKQAQMDRRDFTKGAAALGMAAAAASSGPLVRKAKGADQVIKYAMIGPGSRGRAACSSATWCTWSTASVSRCVTFTKRT